MDCCLHARGQLLRSSLDFRQCARHKWTPTQVGISTRPRCRSKMCPAQTIWLWVCLYRFYQTANLIGPWLVLRFTCLTPMLSRARFLARRLEHFVRLPTCSPSLSLFDSGSH